MSQPEQPEMKHLRRYCALMKKEVWAILTRQPDGRWEIVNCLDKDTDCFEQSGCVFTMDEGQWPF